MQNVKLEGILLVASACQVIQEMPKLNVHYVSDVQFLSYRVSSLLFVKQEYTTLHGSRSRG